MTTTQQIYVQTVRHREARKELENQRFAKETRKAEAGMKEAEGAEGAERKADEKKAAKEAEKKQKGSKQGTRAAYSTMRKEAPHHHDFYGSHRTK